MAPARYVVAGLVTLLLVAGSCGNDTSVAPLDTVAPNPPIGVTMAPNGDTGVRISWDPNTELDLAGYRLYRSSNQGGPFGQATSAVLVCPWYYAQATPMDITYFKVTAIDRSGNESAYSQVVAVYMNGGKRGGPSIPVE